MLTKLSCRACDEKLVVHLHDIRGLRTTEPYPQYYCLRCHSVFHTSGYKEDDLRLKLDWECLLGWKEGHLRLQKALLKQIIARAGVTPKTLIEVGCGCGNLLLIAQEMGIKAKGWDINPYVIHWIKQNYPVDAVHGRLEEPEAMNADMVISICALEHQTEPDKLMRVMIANAAPRGFIAVSVPYFHPQYDASLLLNDKGYQCNHPFNDNDVHVTLFSPDGLAKLGKRLGLKFIDHVVLTDPADGVTRSYEASLFQKV
jgi:SAM-dependent methyltransferase